MKEHKEINLVSNEKTDFKIKILTRALASVLAMVLVGLLVAYGFSKSLNATITLQNEDVLKKIEGLKDVDSIIKNKENLDKQQKSYEQLLTKVDDNRIKVSDTFVKISSIIPKNIYISSISISGGLNVKIGFFVNGPVDTVYLLNTLKNSNMFEKVDMGELPRSNEEKEISFNLKILSKKSDGGKNATKK